MKTLRKGVAGSRETSPYAGKKVTCASCEGEFELEASDRPKYVSDQRDGDYYEITCPTEGCGEKLTLFAR